MDAQKLGQFIAQRRKELGMTQAELAKKLYVTDKAVSRWERGVGLPDINSIELLSQELDVSLVELVQARRTQENTISLRQADQVVSDAIRLPKTSRSSRWVGFTILGAFGILWIFLLWLLITQGSIVLHSVGSLVTGLAAWAAPIWQMTLSRSNRTTLSGMISLGAAMSSLSIQFFHLAYEVNTGDFAAIEDTIHALCIVVVLFCAITLLLNLGMFRRAKHTAKG